MILRLGLALAALPAALALDAKVETGFRLIRAADLNADLTFLSSDPLEGRLSLRRGDDTAIQFVAAEFAKAGLAVSIQPVPLVEYRISRHDSLLKFEGKGVRAEYGYGAGFACGTASGFAFGFTAGAMIGWCWSQPYWGPYYGYGYSHIDINSSNVYHNARGGTTTVNRHYEYDPWENKAKASGNFSSFNPYTNRTTTGGYKGSYDYDNNEYSMKRKGATYDADTGIARAAGSKVTGDLDEGSQTVTRTVKVGTAWNLLG